MKVRNPLSGVTRHFRSVDVTGLDIVKDVVVVHVESPVSSDTSRSGPSMGRGPFQTPSDGRTLDPILEEVRTKREVR